MKIEKIGSDRVRLLRENHEGWYLMPNEEALQLAKDLLDACGVAHGTLTNSEALLLLMSEPCSLTATEACAELAKKKESEVKIAELKAAMKEARRLIGFMTNVKIAEAARILEGSYYSPDKPDVFSGMSLDEIQDAAGEVHNTCKGQYSADLAGLIANLAARMKEQGPKPGERIQCSCGQIHRYCKIM